MKFESWKNLLNFSKFLLGNSQSVDISSQNPFSLKQLFNNVVSCFSVENKQSLQNLRLLGDPLQLWLWHCLDSRRRGQRWPSACVAFSSSRCSRVCVPFPQATEQGPHSDHTALKQWSLSGSAENKHDLRFWFFF